MDRREFLKKAGIGGAGLALGLSGASAFFANKEQGSRNIADGQEEISFYGKHQQGLPRPCRRISILWCSISGRQIKRIDSVV